MSNMKARIAALQSVLLEKDAASFFDGPLEDLDPISRSIVETVRELEALDTDEKTEAYCRENNTTQEEIKGVIHLLRTGHYD